MTTTAVPNDPDLGHVIIVTHGDGSTHAYLIQSIERSSDGATIQLDGDPGFVIAENETRFVTYPQTKITGPNRFRIDRVTTTTWRSSSD